MSSTALRTAAPTSTAFQKLLPDTSEYAILVWGQSNARCWGDRDLEGFAQDLHLGRPPAGQDLTIAAILPAPGSVGDQGAAGSSSLVVVNEVLQGDQYIGGQFRLYRTEFAEATPMQVGENAFPVFGWTGKFTSGDIPIVGANSIAHAASLAQADTATVAQLANNGDGFVITMSYDAGVGFASKHYIGQFVVLEGWTIASGYADINTLCVVTAMTRAGDEGTQVETMTLKIPGFILGAPKAGPDNTHCVSATSTSGCKSTPDAFVITKAGAAFDTQLCAGLAVTLSGFSSTGSTNINADCIVLQVTPTTIVLRTAVGGAMGTTTATGDGKITLVGPVSVGYGRVIKNTGNMLQVQWTVDSNLSAPCGFAFQDSAPFLRTYENVLMLAPYLPEEPGTYPAGVPKVPGLTLHQSVTSYADLGLFLPFAWDEGIEGIGRTGTVTSEDTENDSGFVDTAATFPANLFAGGFVTVEASGYTAWARVGTNTGTGVVLDATGWRSTPASTAPPAGATYTIWAPHWRSSPYEHLKGFRRPLNDPMPTPFSTAGWTYHRPSDRRVPGYVASIRETHRIATSVNPSGFARCIDSGFVVTLQPGVLPTSTVAVMRIRVKQSFSCLIGPAGIANGAEQVPFVGVGARLLCPGDVVQLANFTITSGLNVNGLWRVVGTGLDGLNAYIDLEGSVSGQALGPSTTINVAATAVSSVTLVRNKRHFRFGAAMPLAWRISTMIGRRVRVIHLACNSASQHLRYMQNSFGFHGEIGWWNWNKDLDWTPGNPDGMATRLEGMLSRMAKQALVAEGVTKPLKVIGIFGFQGEGDALTPVGRDTYAQSIRTFYDWLRKAISTAGLAPGGNIPVVHALITSTPYMMPVNIPGGGGDVDGAINAALKSLEADPAQFFVTFDPNTHPKLDGSTPMGADPLHFNGVGEALNAKEAASCWADLAPRSLA